MEARLRSLAEACDGEGIASLLQELLGDAALAHRALAAAAEAAARAQSAPREAAAGAELLALRGVSVAVPKGRFDVVLGASALELRPAKAGAAGWSVDYGSILRVLQLPKPDHFRKAGTPARAYFVVLALREPVQVGKQSASCIVISADGKKPFAGAQALVAPTGGPVADRLGDALRQREGGEPEHATLARLLVAAAGAGALEEPDGDMCACEWFKAYRGVDEGAIYPLRAGICFLPKPPMFIPAAEISRISAGRGGGVHCGATNTDIIVERGHTADASPAVFSNIARGDLPALLAYAGVLAGTVKASAKAQGVKRAKEEEDDEEADEDFEPSDGEAPAPARSAAKRTRGAARAASAAASSSAAAPIHLDDDDDDALPDDDEDIGDLDSSGDEG